MRRSLMMARPGSGRKPMKRTTSVILSIAMIFLAAASQTNSATHFVSGPIVSAPTTQYGDPYSDFRNVRHTNAGLLNERDEIKLGTQLHRQATKKFRLTDVGLDR